MTTLDLSLIPEDDLMNAIMQRYDSFTCIGLKRRTEQEGRLSWQAKGETITLLGLVVKLGCLLHENNPGDPVDHNTEG